MDSCQLYAKDNFGGEMVMKPISGPRGEGDGGGTILSLSLL